MQLKRKQKEWLDGIIYGEGNWISDMGWSGEVFTRLREITDEGIYRESDKELLNLMRGLWLGGVKMRV